MLLIIVFGGWNQKLSKMNDGNTLKKCRLAFWSDKSKRAADKNREKCDDYAVQNIFLPSWYYCMLLQAKKSTPGKKNYLEKFIYILGVFTCEIL